MLHRNVCICAVATLVFAAAYAAKADDLRIVSYNITSAGGTPRAGLDRILAGIGAENVGGRIRPIDLLSMQEVQSQTSTGQSVVSILNGIYGAGAYSRGSLAGGTTGAGTQGVVYNTHTLQLISETAIGVTSTSGAARQTLRYQFRPVGGTAASDFYVYSSHWKAGSESSDAARRAVEAALIRADADALGPMARILYTGDYNVYQGSEAAIQNMLASGNGRAMDPINMIGNWHDNSSYLSIHTQAPSASPPPGLTGGGLDDRFDFQLVSDDVMNLSDGLSYIAGSYHTFGNNGSVPLNGNINAPSSTALSGLSNRTEILNLLTTVGDHLPVVADYSIAVPEPGSISLLMIGTGVLFLRRQRGRRRLRAVRLPQLFRADH